MTHLTELLWESSPRFMKYLLLNVWSYWPRLLPFNCFLFFSTDICSNPHPKQHALKPEEDQNEFCPKLKRKARFGRKRKRQSRGQTGKQSKAVSRAFMVIRCYMIEVERSIILESCKPLISPHRRFFPLNSRFPNASFFSTFGLVVSRPLVCQESCMPHKEEDNELFLKMVMSISRALTPTGSATW